MATGVVRERVIARVAKLLKGSMPGMARLPTPMQQNDRPCGGVSSLIEHQSNAAMTLEAGLLSRRRNDARR